MNDKVNILYMIDEKASSFYWETILRKAVSSFGEVSTINEVWAIRKYNSRELDLIIIDSEDVYDIDHIITSIRDRITASHIVIASDVCTWRRARKAFHLGASEYIQKSLNYKELREQILSVLSSPPPKYRLNHVRRDIHAPD